MVAKASLLVLSVALASVFAVATTAAAAPPPVIHFDGSPGTGAPPLTLGGYTMTPFGPDARPLFTSVTDVPDPAGVLGLTPALSHRRIGAGWGTWSNGYQGDVYRSLDARNVTVTVPANTVAFYLYAEPQPFSTVSITATTQDGTSSGPVPVVGFAGAQYFGFFATGGETIATVAISAPTEFAVGEFGIAVGEVPDCSLVSLDSKVMWPPNHKLNTVTLRTATTSSLEVTVVGVTQDEAPKANGGDPSPDAVAASSPSSVMLRAERSGSGDGRVYQVAYVATNVWGLSCTGSLAVGVPHDADGAAVDSAPPGYASLTG